MVGEGKEVEDMRREGEIGNELTTSVHLCPMSGSFPIQFGVLLVLSGHDSILRIIRFCCLQQCLDGEENCAEGHGCCPMCAKCDRICHTTFSPDWRPAPLYVMCQHLQCMCGLIEFCDAVQFVNVWHFLTFGPSLSTFSLRKTVLSTHLVQ